MRQLCREFQSSKVSRPFKMSDDNRYRIILHSPPEYFLYITWLLPDYSKLNQYVTI